MRLGLKIVHKQIHSFPLASMTKNIFIITKKIIKIYRGHHPVISKGTNGSISVSVEIQCQDKPPQTQEF